MNLKSNTHLPYYIWALENYNALKFLGDITFEVFVEIKKKNYFMSSLIIFKVSLVLKEICKLVNNIFGSYIF